MSSEHHHFSLSFTAERLKMKIFVSLKTSNYKLCKKQTDREKHNFCQLWNSHRL